MPASPTPNAKVATVDGSGITLRSKFGPFAVPRKVKIFDDDKLKFVTPVSAGKAQLGASKIPHCVAALAVEELKTHM
jgi:hypothetical protein